MNREEQMSFVSDLTSTIRNEVQGLIEQGRVPTEWDGHELRMLLAEKFEASAKMSRCHPENRGGYNAKARADYDNDVIVHNL